MAFPVIDYFLSGSISHFLWRFSPRLLTQWQGFYFLRRFPPWLLTCGDVSITISAQQSTMKSQQNHFVFAEAVQLLRKSFRPTTLLWLCDNISKRKQNTLLMRKQPKMDVPWVTFKFDLELGFLGFKIIGPVTFKACFTLRIFNDL